MGVLGIAPEVYYWTTPKELSAMIRGKEMADKAMLGRIRLAVWGEAKDIRKAMGGSNTMTAAEYAELKAEIEGINAVA